MPDYYHYTDDEGAIKIIRTGKIMASLKTMASDDAAYGNGVYLTKLKPPTSTKTEIAQNNWMKTSSEFVNKTKNYFVVDLPDSEVKDFNAAGRNIFLFDNRKDLSLWKFPWWLKDFDSGKIIASYKYTMVSNGPAEDLWSNKMGVYIMTDETVNGRPVYKRSSRPNMYLFMSSKGNWMVNNNAGEDRGYLCHRSKSSLGPDFSVPWEYFDRSIDYNNKWNKDDFSLRAHPWQK